jgi:hypothetical protein
MNQNDLASLLSSVGSGGGAPGLMQGSRQRRVLPGSSAQPATSLLDAFSQQTPDSRPNTAPAGTRSTGAGTAAATGGTTSASGTRPAGSSSSSSKPRNGGTSSSPATTIPAAAAGSATSGGPKGGPIQMSALSSILANLSSGNAAQGASGGAGAAAGAGKPAIDLYDIMSSEVSLIIRKEQDLNLFSS